MRLYFVDGMEGTPFTDERREATLAGSGLTIANDPESCDVIVARRLGDLAPYFPLSKRYHIWTAEPPQFWETGKRVFDVAHGITISISSPFNGDAYPSPLLWFPKGRFDFDRVMETARAKSQYCVMLATYRRDLARYVDGRNVDLCIYRQNLAIHLQKRHDSCHIYGRGWPEDVKREGESRGGRWPEWHGAKLEILRPYRFNLAIENTIAPNYVSEKLWDAVKTGCVPIVYASTGISDILPADAYIDCTGVTDPEEIAAVMAAMGDDERLQRVRVALERFQQLRQTVDRDRQRSELALLLARRLEEEAARPVGAEH